MKKTLLLILLCSFPAFVTSQITFTNSNSSLVNSNLTSGVAIGVNDMNGDGLDDIVRLDNASDIEIEYQTVSGNFTRLDYGNIGAGSEWGMCIADIDANGFNDIIAGGAYNGIKMLLANGSGTNYSSSNLGGPNIFVQNMNFADIDNNGTIDIFSCHDDGVASPYNNNGSGTMTYDLGLINAISTVPSDNSGNYGSIWTDYDSDGDLDLYISKCRIGVNDPNDGRRLNLLFQNDGSGNFTDVAAARGLQPGAQSWAAGFEDLDNDGDFDCVLVNHDMTNQIFLNDGNGSFTDITAASGIATQLGGMGSGGIQVVLEDFDNDTFVDILITNRSGSHFLFKNDGDTTFTELSSAFPGNDDIQSAAVGDMNNDGFLDIMAGFAISFNSPSSKADILYLSNGNSNNYCKIKLNGTTSNKNGIGARLELEGEWGTQIREVRSGESYGTVNSMITHFGLGSATSISKLTVKWPSGTEDVLINPAINTQIEISEGETLALNNPLYEQFLLFPNPAKDFITIGGIIPSVIDSFQIFDINGKLVYNSELFISNEYIKIDTSSYSSGLYFVQLNSNSNQIVLKFIKE